MKSFMIIGLVVFGVAFGADQYEPTNDNIDIDSVINDAEKFKAFYGCFLDLNPCDPVAADFKKDLPEAVVQSCAKCTEAQKVITRKFFAALKTKAPEVYTSIRSKYDPEGKHFDRFEKAVQ